MPKSRKAPSWADPAADSTETNNALSKKGEGSASKDRNIQLVEEEDSPEGLSDMEWMRRRMKQSVESVGQEEKAFEQSDDEDMKVDKSEQKAEETLDPIKETILQTARLFVRNLAFTCTDDELRELFQTFGEVSQVSCLRFSPLCAPFVIAFGGDFPR